MRIQLITSSAIFDTNTFFLIGRFQAADKFLSMSPISSKFTLRMLSLLVLSVGCAGTDDVLRRDAETARLLYLEGMEHLTDSDFEAAITDFTEVSQYPLYEVCGAGQSTAR